MRTVSAEVLEDPAYLVPEAPAAASGIGWLRSAVSRFSNGATHVRRRAIVEELLAAIDPEELRAAYEGHPVARLSQKLGVADADLEAVTGDVRVAAAAYQTGDTAADDAVERLVAVFGGVHDERTAAHLALLVQACDATAALIERARDRAVAGVLRDEPPVQACDATAALIERLQHERVPLGQQARDRAVASVLQDEPPVPATRRVGPDGEVVLVALRGAPFGAGPRACPGRAHALALVEGALR
ncbi:MAG TPA: hypothetical protein VL738_42585 [Dactylosporangium sp.]|nr:hypothetical protein [Dactylosporangium sp.]